MFAVVNVIRLSSRTDVPNDIDMVKRKGLLIKIPFLHLWSLEASTRNLNQCQPIARQRKCFSFNLKSNGGSGGGCLQAPTIKCTAVCFANGQPAGGLMTMAVGEILPIISKTFSNFLPLDIFLIYLHSFLFMFQTFGT